MSFSLNSGFNFDINERNKKRTWSHHHESFGTREHIESFLNTLGLSNVKNVEYHSALMELKQEIEPYIITLESDELPDGAAFRVKDNLDNLLGQSSYYPQLCRNLGISKCVTTEIPQKQLDCYLPYLNPNFYAAIKNASFSYIGRYSGLSSSYYKTISIDDMSRFRFIKLSISMKELKTQFSWDRFMTTPPNVISELNSIMSFEALLGFMTRITDPEANPPIPIDVNCVTIFNEKCKELRISKIEFAEMKKLVIPMNWRLTPKALEISNWRKIVLKILVNNNIELTDELNCLIECVAYFEIFTSLTATLFIFGYISEVIINDVDIKTVEPELFEKLESYCKNEILTELERTEITNINPKVNLQNIKNFKYNYNMYNDNLKNKNNCGAINTKLTQLIINFVEKWYLQGRMEKIFADSAPIEGDVSESILWSHYGSLYRYSLPDPDLLFCVCLNLILFHAFSVNTPVGYYIGQCITIDKKRIYNVFPAELTLARSANVRNIGKVQIVDRFAWKSTDIEDNLKESELPNQLFSHGIVTQQSNDFLGGKNKIRRRSIRNLRQNLRQKSRQNLRQKKHIRMKK